MKRISVFSICLIVLGLLAAVAPAESTTVIKKTLAQLVQDSELVFEGRVLSGETRPSPLSGMPFTYFTFEISEVIKGEYPGQTIELGFMGGSQGGTGISVSDMEMPEVGENGIYFVKSPKVQSIHPLSGWQQGHYLVISRAHDSSKVVVPATQKKDLNRLLKSARLQSVEEFKQDVRRIAGGK
jgi:hypothetical protein